MNQVIVRDETRFLPAYGFPEAEEMPMFAENRIHRRTSGRPYPNRVAVRVNRDERIEKE